MTPIKDSSQTTIVEHSVDLHVDHKNFKTLSSEDARAHLSMLANMLRAMSGVIVQHLPNDGGNNPAFLRYIKKLSGTLDAILLKHRLEAARPNSDIRLSCTIDPTDSGFPVFIRDFKFLVTDKEQTIRELQKLPKDDKLVDDALFMLFRGSFPRNVILQKLARKYYETLDVLTMPEPLRIYPPVHVKEEQQTHYCTLSFERLDDHHNIPRFYTLYLKIPGKTYPNHETWEEALKQAIMGGLSTVVNLELRYLARKVEDLEGVQLEYLERFDIGPFYSTYTENSPTVQALIESPKDYIMMFNKSTVLRVGEEERVGFREWLKGWRSGDEFTGNFSPVIASPQYILMPHRLIQKVHNLNISLKDQTKMFGITSTGEMYA